MSAEINAVDVPTAGPGGSGGQLELFGGSVRHRPHRFPGRPRRVYLRLDDDEHARVVAAAAARGLSPAGFCTEAALGAAAGRIHGADAAWEELAELQSELFAARIAVNRFGGNVNQAVAVLHTTGTPPVWLGRAVDLCARAVERVDEVCSRIHRRLSRPSRRR
jgi:hypothetical protein